VGSDAPSLADADVDRWLAEVKRDELWVDVRYMQERDVAETLEAEKLLLSKAPLGDRTAERAAGKRGGRPSRLQEFASWRSCSNLVVLCGPGSSRRPETPSHANFFMRWP
jgi:hypothetical protein